jgi:EAL domain-containing protein (putative c-di-GMP-specific phosphodiesterase class I)
MSALHSHFIGQDDIQPDSLFLNRGLMNDRVAQAMLHAKITGQQFLLCCIDIDQQANLHDIYGDEGIRELLSQVSSRILSVLRPNDALGQLQNRTLALLLEDMKNWQDIDPTIQKIFKCFVEPVIIDEQPQSISASIGITEFDCQSNVETTELFEQAEFACYRVRRNRVNSAQGNEGQSYAFFGGHILARNSVQKMLSQSIEDGFIRNEWYVDLQPVLQLPTANLPRSCIAVEALMRWRHPQAGVFLPDMLLRLLEENRLCKMVGDRMMTIAARTWQYLVHSGKIGAEVKLSINIHPDQMQHPDFVDSIQQLCATFGLDNQRLILEFKGQNLMHVNGLSITAQLQQLQQLGALICVDNFGDVDAPLLCLHKFPLDMIKLAHGLVSDIETCPRQLVLIEHLQQVCDQLRIQMIVQGVDSAEKMQKLRDIGCTMLQGNYITPPCSAKDLPTFCPASSAA